MGSAKDSVAGRMMPITFWLAAPIAQLPRLPQRTDGVSIRGFPSSFRVPEMPPKRASAREGGALPRGMDTYTIVLERIGTGEPSLSIVTRQNNEAAARAYAEAAIAQSPDLRVVDIQARHFDASTGPRRAAWLDR
jgi:hypothetical protein